MFIKYKKYSFLQEIFNVSAFRACMASEVPTLDNVEYACTCMQIE